MDFRTCPACNSSVLEDDVEDCPFCGASMSGKPKPKPAAKPGGAAASKASAGKKQAASGKKKPTSRPKPGGARKTAPAQANDSASDDPFEVDTKAVRNAIKVSPRKTKTRTMQVVCPMCETTGYINPADGGKDVSCANSECMVPVFKSPRPIIKEEPVEEPKSNKMLLIGGGVAALFIMGLVYRYAIYTPPVVDIPNDEPKKPIVDTTDLLPADNTRVQDKVAPAATLAEIRSNSLESIGTVAEREKQAAAKSECARLATISYARADQLQDAEQQLKGVSGSRGSEYKPIIPLVEIAWAQIRAGKAADAKAHIDRAVQIANSSRAPNREALDSYAALTAILVQQNRTRDANTVLRKHQTDNTVGQFSTVWTASQASESFDVELESKRTYHLLMVEPMRVAAIEILTARGYGDQALAFAESLSNVAAQDESRAAWAGVLALVDPQNVETKVAATVNTGKVSKAGEARAWAAVAGNYALEGDVAKAKAVLARAETAITSVPAFKPEPVPSLKEIYNSKGSDWAGIDNPMPERSIAAASANVGQVNLLLGNQAEAWQHLQFAANYASGMTPSPVQTQELVDKCQGGKAQLIKYQLDDAFNLSGDDTRLTRYFGQYKTQCQQLNEIAQSRLEFQAAILSKAVAADLLDETWTLVAAQANHSSPEQQTPYQNTRLPGLIKTKAIASGNTDITRKIAQDFRNKVAKEDVVDQLLVKAAKLVQNNASEREISDAIEDVYKTDRDAKSKRRVKKGFPLSPGDAARLDWIALRFISRMAKPSGIEEVFQLIDLQSDPTLKLDGFQLIAANSAKSGAAPMLWKAAAADKELETTERAALYHGFILGTAKMKMTEAARETAALD